MQLLRILIGVPYFILTFLVCNIFFVLYSLAEIILFFIFVSGGLGDRTFMIMSEIIVCIIGFRYIDEMVDVGQTFRKYATNKMTIIHSIFTIATALAIIFSRGYAMPILFFYTVESVYYRMKCAIIKDNVDYLSSVVHSFRNTGDDGDENDWE